MIPKEQSSPLRILVVEDEPSYRILYSKVLTRGGHVVVTCKAGDEAIDAIGHGTFDVILLDYKLPGPSGLNILQWMYGKKINVPTIIITGKGGPEIEFESIKWGVKLYLQKMDFDPLTLPDIVTRVWRQHQLDSSG